MLFRTVLITVIAAGSLLAAYDIDIDINSLTVVSTEIKGLGKFDYPMLADGIDLPGKPGEPCLPGMAVSVALPSGMEIDSVNIQYAEPEVIPGYYHLPPAQNPLPIGTNPASLIPPDAGIYNSTSPYPGKLVYTFTSGNMGGYAVGNILLAPVQYLPYVGQLILYRHISFNISLRPASTEVIFPVRRLAWIDQDIANSLRAQVINPEEIAPAPVMLVSGHRLDLPAALIRFRRLVVRDSA